MLLYGIYEKTKSGWKLWKENATPFHATDIPGTMLFSTKKDADIFLKSMVMHQVLTYKTWAEVMRDKELREVWLEVRKNFKIAKVDVALK